MILTSAHAYSPMVPVRKGPLGPYVLMMTPEDTALVLTSASSRGGVPSRHKTALGFLLRRACVGFATTYKARDNYQTAAQVIHGFTNCGLKMTSS
jgi:hypothetical protein